MSNNITKHCPKCNNDFPATNEYFLSRPNGALQSWCRRCLRAAVRNHYYMNKDKVNQKNKEWAQANPEKIKSKSIRFAERHPERRRETYRKYDEAHREQKREYRKRHYQEPSEQERLKKYALEHPEVIKKSQQNYKERHPDRIKEAQQRHRLKRKESGKEIIYSQIRRNRKRALPATLTHEEWESIKAEWNYSCAYFGKAWYEIDGVLTQEHVIPVIQGGGYTADNIVPACGKCNSRKRGRTPEQAGMPLLPKTNHS